MTARYAVRDLIVDYLRRAASERTVRKIIRYMWAEHQVNANVTRTTIYRLVQDGQVIRVARGRYAAAATL